ncbi:hypothetical protein LPB140_10640 [Sphingorhabdus lutea]|uniref:HTH lacI-type domain-containing protein n=2 Tax=Sphingorhabdus lutea TaxID=1913578 RepID=A0A1L3JDG7_9SPHN|nr:hypothetical protein LPB140_10640 [Sphingorhabdus lutea]
MDVENRVNKNPTMVDVARHAGVSLKTVSRVLNGEAHVRKKTRDAVVESANKLDYRLNLAARNLRVGAQQNILLLMNNPSRSYIQNMHFGAMMQCQQMGIQVHLNIDPLSAQQLEIIIQKLSPSGIIVAPPLCDDDSILDILHKLDTKYVAISPKNPAKTKLSVNIGDEKAAFEMTQYLIKLGHRDIGFIKGHPDHGASEKRLRGYLRALRSANITPNEDIILDGLFDYDSGLSAAQKFFNLPKYPSAIFASNDDMAAAVMSEAYRRNIRIPDDISIVGFDDSPIASVISPQLTTLRQPLEALAQRAVRLLHDNLSMMSGGQKILTLEHELIIRSSSGPMA